MKLIAMTLIFCLIIAAAQKTIAVFVVTCLLTLLWGAIFKPARTFGFLALCLLVTLFDRFPGWCLAAIGVVLGFAALKRTNKVHTSGEGGSAF